MEVCLSFADGLPPNGSPDDPRRDMSIPSRLADYIRAAPAGSHLTMAFHTFDDNAGGGRPVAEAIIDKNNSPAKLESVRLLTTFGPTTNAARSDGPVLVEAADNENLVTIRNCGGASCLPNDAGERGGSNHPKLFVLERPGLPTVYSIGSLNLRSYYEGGGTTTYNDAVFIEEAAGGAVTTWLLDFFDRMWAKDWGSWDGSASHQAATKVQLGGSPTPLGESSVKVYAFHRDIDHWAGVLNNITDCDPDGDGIGGYVILMNLSTWSGDLYDSVHQRLDELERPALEGDPDRGCRVRVVAGNLEDTNNSEDDWTATRGFNLNNDRVGYNDQLHNKLLILKDVGYENTAHVNQVFTGSLNLSATSRLQSSELVIRIRNDAVVDAYFDYAVRIWDDSTDLVASAKPLTVSINGD